MLIEQRGTPATVLITEPFQGIVATSAARLGAPARLVGRQIRLPCGLAQHVAASGPVVEPGRLAVGEDLVQLALVLGATFVARSFSGDKKQLLSILKAAIAHRGGRGLGRDLERRG